MSRPLLLMTVKLRQSCAATAILLLHASITPLADAQTDPDEVSGFSGACLPGKIDVPAALQDVSGSTGDRLPTTIESDQIESTTDQDVVLRGNVVIRQGRRAVYADAVNYNPQTHHAGARGDVVLYTLAGDEIRAEAMTLDVDTFFGEAEDVSIRIADTAPAFPDAGSGGHGDQFARVEGETLRFEGREFMVLQNAVMTTCPDGNDDITLTAKELQLDHAAGTGTATGMTVRLKRVPVFYFPSLAFPIDSRRKTGFLFPSIGEEEKSGIILEIPYYIDIAPHMDATITPRVLSERGVQLLGEFRYLGKRSDGSFRAEYLPSDDVFGGQDRHAIRFDHDQVFGDRWQARINLADVSDPVYPRDLSDDAGTIAAGFVTKRASVGRVGELFDVHVRSQAQESVNERTSGEYLPYRIQPEISVGVNPMAVGIFSVGMQTMLTRFEHEDKSRVTGTRTRTRSHVSAPFGTAYGSIEPGVSLYSLNYSLDNTRNRSPSASVPVYSLDGKLVFERLFTSGGGSYHQTLEPRVYYVKIPREEDQNTLPIFDSGERRPTSYSHFFRENRFSGGDRIGDTEQISLGLTSRVTDDRTGAQRMQFSIGQVYHLEDRHLRLDSDDAPLTDSGSGLITELTANLNRDWSVTGFALWGRESGDPEVVWLSADYDYGQRRNASIAYTESGETVEQVNLDFSAPLGPRWQLDVDTDFSLEENDLRSSSIGLGYDGCCWMTRLKYQQYLDGAGESRNRILFTLELDDLGRLRSGLGS